MFFELNKLSDEGVRFDQPLDLADLAVEGVERVAVLRSVLRGSAVPGERGVEFRAHLSATLRLGCSRCLERFERAVEAGVALTIVPDAVEFGVGETEISRDQVDFFYATGGKADLREIAREQIYLHLPLKPVCSAQCRGLCPTCGANRNRIECACRDEGVDPRLAPLLELKKKLSGDSQGEG